MFSQIFKILGTYRVKSNAFLVRLGSHSELF
ncbi:type II toxin-antitoxin system YafQ family toxin [Helicobacter pylori]|nr:type II toxin-antitoxin system YafQ family toxin [Helicobacter pylori]WRG33443.1 type II toxin-antitoxin system YafQ family toxin [Helicobacter pylori]